jgi:hypothetical protein
VRSETVPWSRNVVPVDDELLSSYLIRVAEEHCADPYRFCMHTLGNVSVWNRDVDRTASLEVRSRVAERAQLTLDQVDRMTLAPWEVRLRGRVTTSRWTTGAWINPLGIYHRTRRANGLQACLTCLVDSGAYLRIWRLSFVTVCPRHGSLLIDACPTCEAPLVPHRQMAKTLHCHQCHRGLKPSTEPCSAAALDIPRAQRNLLSALLESHSVTSGNQMIPLPDLIRGVHLLRNWGLLVPSLANVWGARRIATEHRRVSERGAFFESLQDLIDNLPRSLELIEIRGKLTRPRFESFAPPTWLAPLADRLPAKRPRSRKPVRRPTLVQTLRALQATKPPGWRTQRAALLVKAAGRSWD